jgi:sortase (surface protein transpeptidase)
VAAAASALVAVLGATLLVVGLFGQGFGTSVSAPPSRSSTATTTADPDSGDTSASPTGRGASGGEHSAQKRPDFGPVLPGSAPVRLDIPRINVHSSDMVGLGLQRDGSIEVPQDPASPGWFTPGPSPGQYGPAVIAGHVDSKTGPAVFYRLGELTPGDRVSVTRRDGTVATFEVDAVETFEQDAFPTRAVYGATNRAELRLITCSGDYDAREGYLSNTVVFAHLV